MNIPFNKPYLTGKEVHYIYQSVHSGRISGDGIYTRKCQDLLEEKYKFPKCFLTTSCTDALEMAALLLNVAEGDEVIMPSFTFVSTANAFMLRGAKIVFADSSDSCPNISVETIAPLITSKTKVIVVVHYAGVACDMDPIMELAAQHGIVVVEDAANSIDSYYKGRPLGSIGSLGTLSFHESKNVQCGEGGCLIVNDPDLSLRAEIIREKGTNRTAFFRGDVDKYRWVDIGSSFLPSDITAAFLFAQLESIESIQMRRLEIWRKYSEKLRSLEERGFFRTPHVPDFASNNAHIFYLVHRSKEERDGLISFLVSQGILAVFHYLPLHNSPFFAEKHDGRILANAEKYSSQLCRLPLYVEMSEEEVCFVVDRVSYYFERLSRG